jgi:hypothetical protein
MLFQNYETVGHEILYENGCFTRERYWLKDWIKNLTWPCTYIIGNTGRETIVTVDSIRSLKTFEVHNEKL